MTGMSSVVALDQTGTYKQKAEARWGLRSQQVKTHNMAPLQELTKHPRGKAERNKEHRNVELTVAGSQVKFSVYLLRGEVNTDCETASPIM